VAVISENHPIIAKSILFDSFPIISLFSVSHFIFRTLRASPGGQKISSLPEPPQVVSTDSTNDDLDYVYETTRTTKNGHLTAASAGAGVGAGAGARNVSPTGMFFLSFFYTVLMAIYDRLQTTLVNGNIILES
jgi:hypothetical protein